MSMFETVARTTRPARLFGRGAVLSVAAHACVVAFLAWLPRGALKAQVAPRPFDVFFVQRVALPPPPPPAAAAKPVARPKTKPIRPRSEAHPALVAPKKMPEQPPLLEEPPHPPAEVAVRTDAAEGEVAGEGEGVVGGLAGGVAGGVVRAPLPAGPVEFNDAMTPPAMIAGPSPQYTDEALENGVQGLMLVRCVVTVEGNVRDCHVLQSLPFMDRAVVDALEHRRYTPALLQGRPVEVDYTFHIRLMLPQ